MIDNIKTLVDILIVLLIVITFLFAIYKYRLDQWLKTPEGMFDKFYFREKINYLSLSHQNCTFGYVKGIYYTDSMNIRDYWNIDGLKIVCNKNGYPCAANAGIAVYTFRIIFSNVESLPDKIPIFYNDIDTYFINKSDMDKYEAISIHLFSKEFFTNTNLTCEHFN